MSTTAPLMPKARRPRLGIVTIGQAPRVDLHEDLAALLAPGIEVIERGALDALSAEDIERRYPVGDFSNVLVSRLRNGRQVTIAEPDLEPLLDVAIRDTAAECDVVIALCTGAIPDYQALSTPVISPARVVRHGLQALFPDGRLIVMSPDARQTDSARRRWETAGFSVATLVASPYGELQPMIEAAERAARLEADALYLDCMGYTLGHRMLVSAQSGHCVITPRQLVFGAANTLFGF